MDVVRDDLPEPDPLILSQHRRNVVVVGGRERRRRVQDPDEDVEVGSRRLHRHRRRRRWRLASLVGDVQIKRRALHDDRRDLELMNTK